MEPNYEFSALSTHLHGSAMGCPWQKGYSESFNSRFRAECLDHELLYTLSVSRVVVAD